MTLGRSAVWATEIFEYAKPLKAWGMGGVQIPFVKEGDAVMANPAALGFVSSVTWQMFDVSFGLNGQDAYNNFKDFQAPSSPADYNDLIGKKLWVGGAGKMGLVTPNFGLTILSDTKFSGIVRNPAYPEFDVSYFSDTTLAMGFAFAIGPLQTVGATIKQISRWGGNQTIGLSTLSSGTTTAVTDQFQNKGRGFGLDLAYMMKIPTPLNPSFSIVWQDVGSTSFVKTAGVDAPERIKDNLALGAGLLMDLPGLDLSAGMEYSHVLDNSIQLGKKLHFGTELSLPFIDLRAGLNQGYATYGAGLSILFIDFDVALSKVEAGEYPGQTPEDRVLFGLSFNVSIDADFKMTAKDGKKRNLKQRR